MKDALWSQIFLEGVEGEEGEGGTAVVVEGARNSEASFEASLSGGLVWA